MVAEQKGGQLPPLPPPPRSATVLNLPNESFANEDHIRTFWKQCASYDWKIIRLKTISKRLHVLVWALRLQLTQELCGHGMYSQATPGLLNACTTGCDEFAWK